MLTRFLKYSISGTKSSQVKIINTTQDNIYFNIALQEYLFDKAQVKLPTLFLWRNNPTIVIGRHQNPWKQCRIQEMNKNNVLLSRRKSGGGAVYQDLGNTCFSFFTPYSKDEQYNYRSVNNEIIIDALEKCGIKGQVSGRNDLTVEGKKFSGSAYRLSLGDKHGNGRKSLHHGTIMFSVNFKALQKYLNPSKKKLQSKGIDSVISRVINLQQLNSEINHQKFCTQIQKSFIEFYGNNQPIRQNISLDQLSDNFSSIKENYDRLKSWDWLYGQCPYFKYTIQHKFTWGLIQLTFEVKNSKIDQCKVYSDCLFPEFITKINQLLIGSKYDADGIESFKQKLSNQFQQKQNFIQMSAQLCQWIKKEL